MILAIVSIVLFASIVLILIFFMLMNIKMARGRVRAEEELSGMKIGRITGFGSVDSLSVTPVVDYFAVDEGYSTEEGVSYIVKAGGCTILFDIGLNKKREHPSPLLKNLHRAGILLSEIDKIFISHIHSDHVGGLAEQRKRIFSLSAGSVELESIPVYSPGEISPSELNPGPYVKVIKEPEIIGTGLASIGVYPRSLFLIGYTSEQSLAVNVKGKGIVLIIGCGHQSIEEIIKRAEYIFDEPIYGIIGGLHLPVHGGRFMVGPFNLQNIVGVDRKPLRGIREGNVNASIEFIKKTDPQIISLSPHDSSDWTIGKFKESFGDRYTELLVGKEIRI